MALFLGYLGEITGRSAASDLARGAMRTLLRRLEHTGAAMRNIGAFQGWGGILYTLAHLGVILRDGALLEEAERTIGPIVERLGQDDDLDIVGGAAGAIAALLALARARGTAGAALDAARLCGEHLLARGIASQTGIDWRTRIGGDEPQTGFSHGAAGIGWALCELGAATGESRFLDAARRTFDGERRLFWPELRRWLGDEEDRGGRPTMHTGGEPPIERTVAMAWCYGAPGVGLSRLRAGARLDDPALREEAAMAARLTADRGFGQNHCLCHGDLGNLDVLLQAAQAPGAPAGLMDEVRRRTAMVLGSIERDGWRCGTRAGVLSPGLMNGLAGLGIGLLRLAEPARVPSVLALDHPGER
jgi:lantibiotic modifying enzyme